MFSEKQLSIIEYNYELIKNGARDKEEIIVIDAVPGLVAEIRRLQVCKSINKKGSRLERLEIAVLSEARHNGEVAERTMNLIVEIKMLYNCITVLEDRMKWMSENYVRKD